MSDNRKPIDPKKVEALKDALNALNEEDNARLKDAAERLSILATIENALFKGHRSDWRWATLIGVLSLLTTGILWMTKVPTTRVSVNLTCRVVKVKLSTQTKWYGEAKIAAQSLTINKLSALRSTDLGIDTSFSKMDGAVRIESANILLKQLELPRGNELSLQENLSGFMELSVSSGPIKGLITAGPSALVSIHRGLSMIKSQTITGDIPPLELFFSRGIGPIAPIKMRLQSGTELSFINLSIDDISFNRRVESTLETALSLSTIEEGQIRIPDIGNSETLYSEDELILDGLDVHLNHITSSDNAIGVRLEGTFRNVKIIQGKVVRDLRPSNLQWVYHKIPQSIFFAVLVFIWSILWGARRRLMK